VRPLPLRDPAATPITLGGVHHVAYLVENATAVAELYEKSFGWDRYIDEVCDSTTSDRIGRLVGCPAGVIEEAHVIMLSHPGTVHATIEFTTLTPRAAVLSAGAAPIVTAFTVSDAREAFQHLLAAGWTAQCAPQQIFLGGFSPYCATVRNHAGVVVELIDRLKR